MYLDGLTTKKSGRMQRKENVDARIPEIWAAIGVVRICPYLDFYILNQDYIWVRIVIFHNF